MPRNIPFKGSRKLGEEFDPDVVGEEGLDFGEYATEQQIDYSGADKIEGSGFDPLANQAKIEKFGTQTVGRVAGKAGTGYSDFIRGASTAKLESLKGQFKGDPEVISIIEEEIAGRADVKAKIPGSPAGIRGAQISESAAPQYYTESEIKKGTAFYKEELATIDKYLTEVEDIDPKVRASLASEAAELETGLEIEKAMFGQSLEEAEAVQSVIKAGIHKPETIAELDEPVDKQGKTVLEAMTEDVGKATSEDFIDYTKTQTSSGLTTAKTGQPYVRDMTEYWGESTGFMGGVDDVPVEKKLVKKGDELPTGGTAKKTGTKNVTAAMPLDDRQIIAGQKLVREKTRAEKKIEYLKELSTKMHVQGLSTPESAAEISRLEKDVKNMENTLTKMRKNIMPVAANLPGETFLGKIDRGKSFPVIESTSKAGSYGLTATYEEELAKSKPSPGQKPMTDFTAEFKQQNPRVAAATKGAPDPGSPLGVNKPASEVKATDLGDITKSKSYVSKYEETYRKVAIDLSSAAGKVTSELKDIDPAILKKAAGVAATVAANFAKRNPTIGAGLMLFSGLKDFNKPKEKDYFK